MSALKRFLVENGLSITFFSLFAVFFAAQSISGLALYNATQKAHALRELSYLTYLTTGDFLDAAFSNWQAALLQLASLILFGVFIRQKGAPHSRPTTDPPGPKRSAKRRTNWLYANSLGLAFWVSFVLTFVLHALAGHDAYNAERRIAGEAPLGLAAYLGSAKFWFINFQTWEAEYLAIGVYILLSIYLRQRGSPESKPEDASDDVTGKSEAEA